MTFAGGLCAVGLCLMQLGCLDTLIPDTQTHDAPSVIHAPALPADMFVTLKAPADAHSELCTADAQHPNFPNDADLITKAFCQDLAGGVMPTPHGLADLQTLLGLDFKDAGGANGSGGNPAFAILGHSSALTAREVSSLAPTAFVFTPPPADGSKPSHYALMAYDPGETFVEVAVDDPTVGSLNFYLVLFDKDCSAAGCATTDLLTPSLTSGWSNVRVYEDESALGNTIADCRVCHDPDGSGNKILRMQESTAPFTHWLSQQTEGGRALLADFHGAHGNSEDYGPIPSSLIDKTDPALLAQMVTQAGFGNQPNPFDSATIESELKDSAPAQPSVNVPMGWSATWQATYQRSASGQFIAAPYHDVKITDPSKLSAMTSAYAAWLSGSTATLPDIREVFLDDGLRDMGFAPRANADGAALLVQVCQECHNANLDPQVTRDRFLVDQLDQMTRAEKDLAIMRLGLSADTRLFMPPPLFRTITDAERDLMVAELKK